MTLSPAIAWKRSSSLRGNPYKQRDGVLAEHDPREEKLIHVRRLLRGLRGDKAARISRDKIPSAFLGSTGETVLYPTGPQEHAEGF